MPHRPGYFGSRSVAGLGLAVVATMFGSIVAPAGPAWATRPVSAMGKACTIVGTKGNDRLKGTPRADVICGLGGNDTIVAGDGNDIVDGGTDADRIDGGAGNDQLIGGAGNDRLQGGDGDDRIDGGIGSDTIDGGRGRNKCAKSASDRQSNCFKPTTPTPTPVPTPTPAPAPAPRPSVQFVQLTAGSGYTCGLAMNTKTYCWNDTQQPTLVEVPTPDGVTFTQLTAGWMHKCALGTTGWGSGARAYCWGFNTWGQLGNDLNSSLTPDPVDTGLAFTQLAAGGAHTCGLASDTKVWCWGGIAFGKHLELVRFPTPPGVTFSQLTAGMGQACALGSDTTAYCWGSNSHGELGNGDTAYQWMTPVAVKAPAEVSFTQLTANAGGYHTCGLGSDTKAYCWGYGANGQLGDGGTTDQWTPVAVKAPAGVSFTQLTAGRAHTCGLATDTKIYCWGYGADGQLGNGGAASHSTPVAVNTPAGVSFTQLTAGWAHTCGLATDTKIYCWGSGSGRTPMAVPLI